MIYDGDKVYPKYFTEELKRVTYPATVTNYGVTVHVAETQLPHATEIHFDHDTSYQVEQIMQFTGLLDKNGKEIYEGDVVKLPHYVEPGEYVGDSISVVEFIDSAWRLTRIGGVDGFWISFSGCEIIGNVYENPGLLK